MPVAAKAKRVDAMMLGRNAELWVAAGFVILALVAILVWIPADIDTAMIYTHRRQTHMGDAFMPMIAAGVIGASALVHGIITWRRPRSDRTQSTGLDVQTLSFLLPFLGIVALSLVIMYWAGPLAVSLFAQGDGDALVTYRQMRGTYPYKIIGYGLGGVTMVFLTNALIEGRFAWQRLMISILAVAALIAIFDLPLDTILLPPNGD